MNDKIVILSTCATKKTPHASPAPSWKPALAACVNIVPRVRSFYRWKGAVEDADRVPAASSSRPRPLFTALRSALEKTHPYEVPEIIALPDRRGRAELPELAWRKPRRESGDE